jgi:hypothetical protein
MVFKKEKISDEDNAKTTVLLYRSCIVDVI